ncbi:phosphoribosyltransferase family protein [Paralimibaculum aggregatum]|uniref:Phosphoribosyltransferase family protein n=1 Tax=Paralimibaculum aggregatum TaxID=3036245 RepID=A0ABQ6LIR6_9RHOB|nr:phosphoribosyltransferase family protein [Limibaculum sp. NKW23]
MLPATMIALLMDRPLLDLESFLAGRLPGQGTTRPLGRRIADLATVRRVLLVDDSVTSGQSIAAAKARVAAARPDLEPLVLAVIASPPARAFVDIHFDVCPMPRIFEWNLFNSWVCAEGCFDLDGIFCRDPSGAENDDGPRYRAFLRDVAPLRRPGQPLRRIVTARLGTYRAETEAWLARHGIAYERLDMLEDTTAEERREGRMHAPFKARIYASDPVTRLFVESDPEQAAEIARLSGKPVLSFAEMRIVDPAAASLPRAVAQLRRSRLVGRRLAAGLLNRLIRGRAG